MINQEITLLEPFVKSPWKGFTFKEIKKLSKNKSDNYVHTGLKRFVQKGILDVKKVGNTLLYVLNDSVLALTVAGFLAEYAANNNPRLPHTNIKKIIHKIKTSFFVFIVAGSYAKNTQKIRSDLDLVIICDNKQDPNKILANITLESELMAPELHPYVFTQEQFYQMLLTEDENYGKEIARNNVILRGGSTYYSIITEAAKHGFSG